MRKGTIAARAICRQEATQVFPSSKDEKKRDKFVEEYWTTTWWWMIAGKAPPTCCCGQRNVDWIKP